MATTHHSTYVDEPHRVTSSPTSPPAHDALPDMSTSRDERPSTPVNATDWRSDASRSLASTPSSGLSGSPQRTKRTSSGELKRVDIAPAANHHPRQASTTQDKPSGPDSPAGKISQLSAQLKTQLAYAMVKVQNGWESRSIDEVESLASQLSSPASTYSSTFKSSRGSHSSPRVAMAGALRHSRDPSHVDAASHALHSTSPSRYAAHTTQWPYPAPRRMASTSPASVPGRAQITTSRPPHPGLGPAADFSSAPRGRRTSTSKSRATPSHSQTSSQSQVAYPRATTPTPQEQDAVDSLLFMSSPANATPAHFAAPPVAASPLHADSRPGLSQTSNGKSDSGEEERVPRHVNGKRVGREDVAMRITKGHQVLRTARDVDNLLGDMANEDADDEDFQRVGDGRKNVASEGGNKVDPMDVTS